MKRLRNKLIRPPGGWRYVDTVSNYTFDSDYNSFDDLVSHVVEYRVQNGIDVPADIQFQIECWLCAQPDMDRYCMEAFSRSKRTPGQYLRGAKAAARMIANPGAVLVPQGIAEKRAAICVNCPYNKLSQDDSRLRRYSDKFVARQIGSPKKTQLDDKLFTCEICSCQLRVKVHISQEIVKSSLDKEEVVRLPHGTPGLNGEPLYCWQIKAVSEE